MTIHALPGAFEARIVYRPQLRFTPSGQACASFTVASSRRRKDATTGEWSDGPSTFVRVTAWRALAEHVAESNLEPGDVVVLAGDLELREWEGSDDRKRRDLELTARTVGLSCAKAPVALRRIERGSPSTSSAPAPDPTAASSPDPWTSSAADAPPW